MSAELTAEQKQALEVESRRQAAVSLRFLQLYSEYKNTPDQNQKLAEYIRVNSLTWDLENLEYAYDRLDLNQRTAEEVAKAIPINPVQESQPYPWPTPLSAAVIRDMSREDYRRFVKIVAFRQQVAALGMRR